MSSKDPFSARASCRNLAEVYPPLSIHPRKTRSGCIARRVKTKKQFYRPMNRVVQAHLKSILPADPQPEQPVFDCGSSRPNAQFQLLCRLAGVKPKQDVETGEDKLWVLKDLPKTLR